MMKPPDLWSAHPEWIQALSLFLGCPLRLVEGSETLEVDAFAATLEGVIGPPHPGVTLEVIVKLLATQQEDADVAVWAGAPAPPSRSGGEERDAPPGRSRGGERGA